MSRLPLEIRELPSLDGDAGAYVLDSWRRSARGTGMCRRMPGHEYERRHGPLLRELASRGTVLMASMDDLFLGWVCGEPQLATCHYLYTKGAYRRCGVARQLVESFALRVAERAHPRLRGARVRHTHLPSESMQGHRDISDWIYGMGWVYCPHAMWIGPEER